MTLDSTLFADVADALGIAHPAIVEKDYYGVQLLKLLSELESPDYILVFAGGTSLTKAHQNTYRMSEDIDIKFIPNDETLQKSRTKQGRLRRKLRQDIVDVISSGETFSLVSPPHSRNEYKFQQLLLEYPSTHEGIETLRPHIQLELTESTLFQQPRNASISSLYAESTNQKKEVSLFPCVELESTAAEKFIALLRRTAAFTRDSEQKDDPTIVRHIYDLHLICEGNADLQKIKSLVQHVIKIDTDQFSKKHSQFRENPTKELLHGFETLKNNSNTGQRYADFIGPLVYHPNPANFQTALSSLEILVEHILKNQ